MEQLQMLMIPPPIQQDKRKDRAVSEQYIGIKHAFPDPYHLYLHVGDLESGSPRVRFVVYSMGKKKVIFAGMYRRYSTMETGIQVPYGQFTRQRNNDPFVVLYACSYSTSDLMTYVSKISEDFKNAVNIMKNRISSRVAAFSGIPPPPYLRNQDDYVALKAWLLLNPYSKYHRPDKNVRIVKSLISDEYLSRLKGAVSQFALLEDLQARSEIYDNENDIEEVERFLASKLDHELAEYESRIHITSKQTRDEAVLDISEKFVKWLETSRYTSDWWVRTLDKCVCTKPTDTGCIIQQWGKDEDLR